MEPQYSVTEILFGLLGIGLTGAFTLWAWVVKRATETAETKMDSVIQELKALREEIHHDRLAYERRFMRLESHAGFSDID